MKHYAGGGARAVIAADLDNDIDLDLSVATIIAVWVFDNCLSTCVEMPRVNAEDANGDGVVNVFDVIRTIDVAFRGQAAGSTTCVPK